MGGQLPDDRQCMPVDVMSRAGSWRTALLAAGAGLVAGSVCAATEPQVEQLSCAAGIHVRSGDAPLSVVLRRMSEVLRFDLVYAATDDPVIKLDAKKQPLEWVAALSERANLIVSYGRDRRCPSQWRIATVWVLPTGTEPARPRALAAPTPTPAPAPAQGSPPRGAAQATIGGPAIEVDESTREYMKMHGMIADDPAAKAPAAAPAPAPQGANR